MSPGAVFISFAPPFSPSVSPELGDSGASISATVAPPLIMRSQRNCGRLLGKKTPNFESGNSNGLWPSVSVSHVTPSETMLDACATERARAVCERRAWHDNESA